MTVDVVAVGVWLGDIACGWFPDVPRQMNDRLDYCICLTANLVLISQMFWVLTFR